MPFIVKDLPDNTVLRLTLASGRVVVYVKNHPTSAAQWRGTDGSYVSDFILQSRYDGGGSLVELTPGGTRDREVEVSTRD